jgi:hypothetical protein
MTRACFAMLLMAPTLLLAGPVAAQQRGGVALGNPAAALGQIDANSAGGCPLSATSVTVGVNKATATGSMAQQSLATLSGRSTSGCKPLVSTQVVAGVNTALGGGSFAGQSISAKGPGGALATNTYTRGVNVGYGAFSTANQHLSNQTGR